MMCDVEMVDLWLFFILFTGSVAAQQTVGEGGVSLCPGKPKLCSNDPDAPSWCRQITSCDEFYCASASEDCHLQVSSTCYVDLVSLVAKYRGQHFGFCLNRGSCQSAQGETYCECDEPTYQGTHCEILTERDLQGEEPTFAPSGSAHPTGTFYPTISAYPTVTSFPTSAFPSVTGIPTGISFSPSSSSYPTGMFLPTGTPLPTSSTNPTITSVPSFTANVTIVPSIDPTSTGDEGSILPSIAPSMPATTPTTTKPATTSTPRPTRSPIAQQEPTPNYRPTSPSSNSEGNGDDDDDDMSSAGIGAILVGIGALLIVIAWFVRPCSGRRGNGSSHRQSGYRSELELQHFDDDLF